MADQNKVDDTAFLAHWDAVNHNYGVGEFHAAYHAAHEAWFAAVPAVPAVDALTDERINAILEEVQPNWWDVPHGATLAFARAVEREVLAPTAPADPEQAKLDSLAQAGLAAALENHARQPQAAPEATSEPDEPTDREQLIACLGDDAATLIAQNPDDEMAQTMLDAAAMLEAGEQMGGAQVAQADPIGYITHTAVEELQDPSGHITENPLSLWHPQSARVIKERAQVPVYLAAPATGAQVAKWESQLQSAHPNSEPQHWPDDLKLKYMAVELAARRAPTTERAAEGEATSVHPDDIAVDRFAVAMKAKMAKSRANGRGGWDDPAQCTVERLAAMLVEHVGKGDPVDVANFAMMIHLRDGSGIDLREALAVYMNANQPYVMTPEQLEDEMTATERKPLTIVEAKAEAAAPEAPDDAQGTPYFRDVEFDPPSGLFTTITSLGHGIGSDK